MHGVLTLIGVQLLPYTQRAECCSDAQASKDIHFLPDTHILGGYEWQWEFAHEHLGMHACRPHCHREGPVNSGM